MASDIGVRITNNVALTCDWKKFAEKMSEVVAQGFATAFGITDGIGHGISALISAVGAIKIDLSPGDRAWELFCLSFAWSFDSLRATGSLGAGDEDRAADLQALSNAREKIGVDQYYIKATFLAHPSSLQLFQVVRDEFIASRATFRAQSQETPEVLKARFDVAFNRAVFEIWSRSPDKFQPIAAALEPPGLAATEFDRSWEAYRQRLMYDFNVRAVFGQEDAKISLSQLYVPLRGIWDETDDTAHPSSAVTPPRSKKILNLVALDDMLDRWVNTAHPDDDIRLIGGGPGSGKSTTLKSFVSRLAARPDVRPLYVPLQYIDIDQDLRTAINNYFTAKTDGSFRQPPLSRDAVEHGPRMVIVFDGLDEIAKPGEAAAEVANLFATKLNQLMSSLQGEGKARVLYIASGRMPSFQAARKYLSAHGIKSYAVSGYDLPSSTADIEIKGPPALLRLDQRAVWWQKYAEVSNVSARVPPALTDERLAEITNEPLLCYLLALSGYATTNWEEAANNQNRIYARLIRDVWTRSWGEGKGAVRRQGPGKALPFSEFIRLMETIALAAWRGGDTRVASESRFIEATKLLKTEKIWESFKEINGPDVGNLALNFYLKSAESEHRGFEFTHKSFGDYLVATSLCSLAFDLTAFIDRRLEFAASEWLNLTGQGELTIEILDFVRDEMRLRKESGGDAAIEQVKQAFEELASYALSDGFPATMGNSLNWRAVEKAHNSAEIAAWAILSASNSALGRRDSRVKIRWPDSRAFSRLLSRLSSSSRWDGLDTDPIRHCFSHLDCVGSDLFLANLRGADLTFANLNKSILSGADLCNANLEGATIEGAEIDRTHLDGSRLDFASLKNSTIVNANFDGALFNETDVSGALISKEIVSKFGLKPFISTEKNNHGGNVVKLHVAGVLTTKGNDSASESKKPLFIPKEEFEIRGD